ncbi:isoprenoid synthase domain-containing protein [Trichoderma velutinum]
MAQVQRAPNDPRPSGDPRTDLSARIRTKLYYLPNLRSYYNDWPDEINPHYAQLKEAIEARIKKHVKFFLDVTVYSPKMAAALIDIDYALLSCIWWPQCEYKRLEVGTFWSLWLFTWDDEIDQSTSELFINLESADRFRDETYHFVRYVFDAPNEETHNLADIGEEVKNFYNHDQIMCLVDEIYYYMENQQREQHRKLAGVIPTPAQYIETRLGTSAVQLMLALNEYVDNQCIPRWIMTHSKMADLWRETNLNMSLSNDMVSLRKEIKTGDIESMISILVYNCNMTVQEAIADTCVELKKNVDRFDAAAEDLLAIVAEKDSKWVGEVDRYIVGCRHNMMANLLWSLTTTRYGLGKLERDIHGGMTVVVNHAA